MTMEYNKIRALTLEYIKRHPTGDQFNLHREAGIRTFFRTKDYELNDDGIKILREVIHELYHERIIIFGGQIDLAPPWYQLTEYGKQMLENAEYQPYDPSGYLSRLKADVPNVHQDVIRYLEEALRCFRTSCFFATAVMIGCATEKGILQLIETFGDALQKDQEKTQYKNKTKKGLIKDKYGVLRNCLLPKKPSLPPELRDGLEVKLDQIFSLIRTIRNDAGHPTSTIIDKETVHANLLLFPINCRLVYGLINYFGSHQV